MTKTTNEVSTEQKLILALDSMCQAATGPLCRIRGIARCALLALESDSVFRNPECIAEALMAIALEADMAQNDVSVEAEAHGISTLDPAWKKRLEAACRARDINAAKGV